MTRRHRFCQRNAETTTSSVRGNERYEQLLRSASISHLVHPLTASYIKTEMTSKDSIKIKKYQRRYMCKTCCNTKHLLITSQKKHHSESKTWVIAQNTLEIYNQGSDGDTVHQEKQKIIIKSGSCRPAQVLTLSLIHLVSPPTVWTSALSVLLSSNLHACTLVSTGTVSGHQLGHKSRLQPQWYEQVKQLKGSKSRTNAKLFE